MQTVVVWNSSRNIIRLKLQINVNSRSAFGPCNCTIRVPELRQWVGGMQSFRMPIAVEQIFVQGAVNIPQGKDCLRLSRLPDVPF